MNHKKANCTATSRNRHGLLSRLFWTVGFVMLLPAASASVSIDQAPLTVQKPLPPNIILMLDDSGSMAWDYMPDWDYLSDNSDDGVRDSGINGVYYNPNVDYTAQLPPTADGGNYPNSGTDPDNPMDTAWLNGFDHDKGTTDVTKYSSQGLELNNEGGFPYYTQIRGKVSTSYPPSPGCAPGDDGPLSGGDHAGQCRHDSGGGQSIYPAHDHRRHEYCDDGDQITYGWYQHDGRWHRGWYCIHVDHDYSYPDPTMDNPSCPQGGNYDSNMQKCVLNDYASAYLFTYTTGSSGNYTRHFVAKDQQDCQIAMQNLSGANAGADCVYDLKTRQNVANWFSYYRTRMLMAKSGLMAAFDGLSADTRFGFGSINHNNSSNLPSPKDGSVLAKVASYGDGSSGTQKASFWQWLVGESPNGGTPLREALDDVGRYYETAQPWQNSSSDDTTLACRLSYTILTTDGFWNGNYSSDHNTDGKSGPQNTGPNNQKSTYSAVPPFSDNYSGTLADVAMQYWKNDLRSTLANEVPHSKADPAFWQHMTTFTMGLGFLPVDIAGTDADGSKDGTYGCSGSYWHRDCGFDATSPDTITDFVDAIFNWTRGTGSPIQGFKWPEPSGSGGNGGSIDNIADLVHAAVNGHGGFYSATDPNSFISGIADALQRVTSRTGTGSSLAASSTKLQTGTTIYQAFYSTGSWSGDLLAFAIDPATGAIGSDTNAKWSAADQIPDWADRNVYTCKPDADGGCANAQIRFDVDSLGQLSSTEQTALGTDTTSRTKMAQYLLGDHNDELTNNGSYRSRDTVLGDIVDSQPVFEGAPNPDLFSNQSFSGSSDYASFANGKSNRTKTVWVAANDGMLHEFSASTGVEMYAYLPAAVITSGIADLADPTYGVAGTTPHNYYNDGQLTIADAYVGGSWKTVLVGTTGRGPARAVYALDVTNPNSPTLMWEKSGGAIGQMTGKPIIAQTGNGSWSVLIGNGYDSSTGAALLQFALGDGTLSVHSAGTTTNTDNGLAPPAVWIADPDTDIATIAYAGDLEGQVWSFDLGTANSSGTLLYTAKDAADKIQPITAGMAAAEDPTTGNRWLFFGTGQYLNKTDFSNRDVQTWYGLIVKLGNTPGGETQVTSAGSRADLMQRSILAEVAPTTSGDSSMLGGRVVSPGAKGDMSGKAGWYVDLVYPATVHRGERMVVPDKFQGGYLIGTTRIPVVSDPCNPSGSGWVMAINPFAGTNPGNPFFDTDGDHQFTDADKISYDGKLYATAGVGFTSVPNAPIFVGHYMLTSTDSGSRSSLAINPLKNAPGAALGRISWRELVSQ